MADSHYFEIVKAPYLNEQEAQLSQRGSTMLQCSSVVSFNIPTAQFFLLPVTAASD